MAGRRHTVIGAGAALLAAVALLATAIAASSSGGTEPAAAARGGALKLKRVGAFDAPVHVDNAPGQPRLLFVVEQPGRVMVVRRGRKLGRPFVDIRNRVRFGGEQGLLSIAFHPRYERNRRFFVYYVNDQGNIEVDRFKRKPRSPTRAAEGSRRKVIEIGHPSFDNHNGGQLQFGPDGFLYIGTGDGGSAGDPRENAQDRGSLLGKLLRIAPGGRNRYRSPRSNPFAGGVGRNAIYALGLRNPFRFSFDAKTGALVIGDVGQNRWEEIDYVRRGAGRGANFGWDLLEGNHGFEGDPGDPPANYVAPIHEYATGQGGACSVIGGYVVRDRGLRSLTGRYVYGDFCVGDVRSLDPDADNPPTTDRSTGLRVDSLSSFGEGARNRLYATSLGGPVYRVVAR